MQAKLLRVTQCCHDGAEQLAIEAACMHAQWQEGVTCAIVACAGPHEREGHPPAGRGGRLLHGRRRVRARHGGREHHRARQRHHLPGRPPARQGGALSQ